MLWIWLVSFILLNRLWSFMLLKTLLWYLLKYLFLRGLIYSTNFLLRLLSNPWCSRINWWVIMWVNWWVIWLIVWGVIWWIIWGIIWVILLSLIVHLLLFWCTVRSFILDNLLWSRSILLTLMWFEINWFSSLLILHSLNFFYSGIIKILHFFINTTTKTNFHSLNKLFKLMVSFLRWTILFYLIQEIFLNSFKCFKLCWIHLFFVRKILYPTYSHVHEFLNRRIQMQNILLLRVYIN